MTPQQIYSNVPIENLFAIYQFKEAALIKKYKQFVHQWIMEKRCVCVESLSKNETLNCKHFQETSKKMFKKEKKELWNLSLNLIQSSNVESHSDQKWLKSWEL